MPSTGVSVVAEQLFYVISSVLNAPQTIFTDGVPPFKDASSGWI